jgi:hypothetical protein
MALPEGTSVTEGITGKLTIKPYPAEAMKIIKVVLSIWEKWMKIS